MVSNVNVPLERLVADLTATEVPAVTSAVTVSVVFVKPMECVPVIISPVLNDKVGAVPPVPATLNVPV
jgi:hypothetical protein